MTSSPLCAMWNGCPGFPTRADKRQETLMRNCDEFTITEAVLGPFYVADPPELSLGTDISGGTAGEPLFVSGTVTTAEGRPIPEAIVDTWHSDDDGYYDVQRPDETGRPAMRARFRTDEHGRF